MVLAGGLGSWDHLIPGYFETIDPLALARSPLPLSALEQFTSQAATVWPSPGHGSSTNSRRQPTQGMLGSKEIWDWAG